MSSLFNHKSVFSCFLIIFFTTCFASANTVSRVKGNRVLLLLTTLKLKPNDIVGMVIDGKVAGKAKVLQVKADLAVADVIDGEGAVYAEVVPEKQIAEKVKALQEYAKQEAKQRNAEEKAAETKKYEALRVLTKTNELVGFKFSFNNHSMSAEVKDVFNRVERINLKGSSFSLGVDYDYPFTDSLELRLGLGFFTYKLAGSSTLSVCDNQTTTNCEIDNTYGLMFGGLKYYLSPGRTRVFSVAGISMMYETQGRTTILKDGQIRSTMTYDMGLGLEHKFSDKFIFLGLDYKIFPTSTTISASTISASLGFGLLL